MRHVPVLALTALFAAACHSGSSPASPTLAPLAATSETEHYVFHVSPGAPPVDAAWQEAYHQWAVKTLGVRQTRKVGYYLYASRMDMGNHTGQYNTNGYADVSTFDLHTLWSTDNHEVVHLLMSLVGESTALFSEGIAVAFQTDPVQGNLNSVFNGEEVHTAARRYLLADQLVLPLDKVVESTGFRAISDGTLAYREAGSFVRFLIDRYGLEVLLTFFRAGGSYSDAAQVVKGRFLAAFGVPLEQAEAEWLAMLRGRV